MDLIDKFIKGDCCIDLENSSLEDLELLSNEIKCKYPYSGTGHIDGIEWDYPTLMSFIEDYKNNEVCFYYVEKNVFDGYGKKTNFPQGEYYTAEEMLNWLDPKEINESEIMDLFKYGYI